MSKLTEAFFESLESPKIVARKLWLCRFPIFFSIILVLVGPLGILKGATILGNGFLICDVKQMVAITVISLLSATLLLKQMSVVFRQAHIRFVDIPQTDSARPGAWNWLQTTFLIAAGLSLPLTCWIHSMHEAGADFIDDPAFSFTKGLTGLIIGLLVYFLLFLLTAAIQNALEPKVENQPVLSMPLLEHVRVWFSLRFKKFKRYFQEGHFDLFLDFLILLIFYVAVYASTRASEMTPIDMFTSPFYLVLALTMLSMTLSGVSYFLDYYRTPTSVIVLVLLLGGYLFSDFDHRFPVVRIEGRQNVVANVSSEIKDSKASDSNARSHDSPDEPDDYYIVVAPGGGIHAAAWTGKVLAGLHERYGEPFAQRLKLISAVSGGAVGTMFYLDHFPHLRSASDATAGDPTVQAKRFQHLLEQTFRRSSTSSLEALAWGSTFPDAVRLFFGKWIQQDRGMVQERRWLRRMDVEGDNFGPTLYSWKREASSGRMPYVTFNATEAETGRRVLFSTYQFKQVANENVIPLEARAIDFLSIANERFDLPISTAVRLSATFPYVAAAAMPAKDTLPLGHIVDGGYVDNEGLLTAIDFIRQDLIEPLDSGTKGKKRRYVIIRILHTPPVEDHLISPTDPGLSGSGWEYASFGPLMAMSNVRATSQRERGEIELMLLKQSIRAASDQVSSVQASRDADDKSKDTPDKLSRMQSEVVSVVLQFTPPTGYQAPPLNWKLSPKQRAAYQTAWDKLTQTADMLRMNSRSPTNNSVTPAYIHKEFEGLEWFEQNLIRNP
jgi:Patatin-like phospholipase